MTYPRGSLQSFQCCTPILLVAHMQQDYLVDLVISGHPIRCPEQQWVEKLMRFIANTRQSAGQQCPRTQMLQKLRPCYKAPLCCQNIPMKWRPRHPIKLDTLHLPSSPHLPSPSHRVRERYLLLPSQLLSLWLQCPRLSALDPPR